MTKRIQLTAPNQIQATIQLPSSKSICNRALIIRALAQSHAPIENLSDCDDTRVMVKALQEMKPVIDIMAAGTAMRFLTAYLSVTEGSHLITGTERMKQRPIRILVDALRSLGAQIEYAAEDYRNRTDPKRNQSAGKCQFAIHFGPADDRSRFEKRFKTHPDRRNHLASLH